MFSERLPWSACSVDGVVGRPLSTVQVGQVWSWAGAATVRRASASVGYSAEGLRKEPVRLGRIVLSGTGGVFTAELLQDPTRTYPELSFDRGLPFSGQQLEILDLSLERPGMDKVICFAAGTMIETPKGAKAIETLRPGDKVWTRDNGYSQILWAGRRRIAGAALASIPALRPLEVAPGVLVSPDHRLLDQSDETAIVPANAYSGRAFRRVLPAGGVTYVHLLLERHELIRAGGIDSETFHPASMPLTALSSAERGSLIKLFPGLLEDPASYGPLVRPERAHAH